MIYRGYTIDVVDTNVYVDTRVIKAGFGLASIKREGTDMVEWAKREIDDYIEECRLDVV